MRQRKTKKQIRRNADWQYTWVVLFLVLHDINDFAAGAVLTRYGILRELVLIGGNSADAAGILVETLACRARRVNASRDALQEPAGVRRCRAD